KNALTQYDLNQCAGEDYKRWDDRLNQTYNRIISKLDGENLNLLVKAQRAWVKYRDANCEAERQLQGGSIAPMTQAYCLRDNTKYRIGELERIYESDETGPSVKTSR